MGAILDNGQCHGMGLGPPMHKYMRVPDSRPGGEQPPIPLIQVRGILGEPS